MQLTIEAIGEQKTSKYGPFFGVKAGGVWYNVQGERQDLKGKMFEAEVKGDKFKWAKLGKEIGPASNGKAGGLTWWDYATFAKLAHGLAIELEPDGVEPFIDRSQARGGLVDTAMIAFTNGKVALPREDDEVPPPDDSDMPF